MEGGGDLKRLSSPMFRASLLSPTICGFLHPSPTDRPSASLLHATGSLGGLAALAGSETVSEKLLHSESKRSIGGGAAARLDRRRRRPGQAGADKGQPGVGGRAREALAAHQERRSHHFRLRRPLRAAAAAAAGAEGDGAAGAVR